MKTEKELRDHCVLNSDKIHVLAEQLRLTNRRLNRLTILYFFTTVILAVL